MLLYIHVYHKWRSYDIWFLKYRVWQTKNFVILGHFLHFQPPDNLENQNFKIEKNTWRYGHFTHLHHKWQSYDVWFVRYGAHQIVFFVILNCFLPFYSPIDSENQTFERTKKILEDVIILQMCAINDSHNDVWFLRYGVEQTEFFVILDGFLPFYPLNNLKN